MEEKMCVCVCGGGGTTLPISLSLPLLAVSPLVSAAKPSIGFIETPQLLFVTGNATTSDAQEKIILLLLPREEQR